MQPIALFSLRAFVCCWTIAALAQTSAGNGPSARFLMAGESVFTARDITMTVKSGIPFFRASVQNDSGSGWVDVTVSVSMRAKCPNEDVHGIQFQASLGYLQPGESAVSDAIVSARRAFGEGCELIGVDSITLNKGSVESASAARARAERMKADGAEKKRIQAAIEIDAQHVKDLAAARDAEQQRNRNEAERERAIAAEAQKNCHVIFQATADKKVSELTVREAQAVNACQTLGYYK